MASYETYSPQDTAFTTPVVEVAVAICFNSLLTPCDRLTRTGQDNRKVPLGNGDLEHLMEVEITVHQGK